MVDNPTVADAARGLEEEFALFDDWRDKVEYLIELGKDLPPLPERLKTEGNKVRGCQSQVWMVAKPEAGGRIHCKRRLALTLSWAPPSGSRAGPQTDRLT